MGSAVKIREGQLNSSYTMDMRGESPDSGIGEGTCILL